MKKIITLATAVAIFASVSISVQAAATLVQGNDSNVQTSGFFDNNTGRDMSQENSDFLRAQRPNQRRDFAIVQGKLGRDMLLGTNNKEIIIGGTEHFVGPNKDIAFGGKRRSFFLWTPGDGSDYFNGGEGVDTIVFGLIREDNDFDGVPDDFAVFNDGQAGNVVFDAVTGLPEMNVGASPGFCEVNNDPGVAAVNADALILFGIRAQRDNGDEDGDDGKRVTISTKNVEFAVCTESVDGGDVDIFDLRVNPPQLIEFNQLPRGVQRDLAQFVVDFQV